MLPTLLACVLSATPTVHQRLCEVNAEWNKVTPADDLLAPASYDSERALLKDHLRRVEARLRAADTSSLTSELKAARARTLDRLHEYTATQECPLNETQPTRVPVMIDSLGRHCPVAQLMAWDGQDALVREVARSANNILVRDLTDPRFLAWAHSSGLSIDELAAIQPAYTPVMRWKVAVAAPDAELPTKDELRALKSDSEDGYRPFPHGRELKQTLKDVGLPRGALRGMEQVMTASPVVFNGEVYIAVRVPQSERDSYQLRRWTGKTWERVETFPVPINALAEYDGHLYVGGGGHPFSQTEHASSHHAFIKSWDGETWNRVTTEARGQVQAFVNVRGNLVAAVTHFEWPM
jgi:hypothetical protein